MAAPSRSVLERLEKRAYMDDTIPLKATIITHKMLSSHAEYVIRVQRGPSPEDSWEVVHRYSDFAALNEILQLSGINLPLPQKKVFKNMDRQFLVERQQGLQVFLNAVIADPLLHRYVKVKKFLDPVTYAENFYEAALRNVSMFFRSEPNWAVVEPLREIGWRFRKQYYLIASKTDPKMPKHLLTWCEPGPDSSLGDREMEATMKLLTDIRHPYILSPVSATYNGTGVMVVRRFNPAGSLRDLVYGAKPQEHVLHKYGQPARGRRVSIADVRKYGRQVLEVLHFLSEKGFVLGHLHAGNVIVEGGDCKLVDIENSLLGLPSLYRHHLLEIRKIHTHVGEVVYSFGHMLYEVCLGYPLRTALMESCPPNTPESIIPILESILTAQGIKNGPPSIADLLTNPFFSEVTGVVAERPSMRVNSKLREVLQSHLEKGEQRLYEQQRKVAQQKRISKAHENLMSEEEKKKRRKKQKKQMSLQEPAESEAYPTTTSLPRQQSLASSSSYTAPAKVRAASSAKATSKTTATVKTASSSKTVPPPPAVEAAEPRPPPPKDGSRGALLSSIEGFRKGKLKKTVTKDRSAPLIR